MKQFLHFAFTAIILTALLSCKKDKDVSGRLLNATVYVDNERALANIAFLKTSQEDVLKNETTLSTYFKTRPENSDYSVSQYKTYLPDGDYIIAIQLVDFPTHSLAKHYTYKRVTISADNPGFGNVMQFKETDNSGYYHLWNEKKL